MLSFEMPQTEGPRTMRGNPFAFEKEEPKPKKELLDLESEIKNQQLNLDLQIKKYYEINFELNQMTAKRNEMWVALKNAQNYLLGLEAGNQYYETISANPKLRKTSDEDRARVIQVKKLRTLKQIESINNQIPILDSKIPVLQKQSIEAWTAVTRFTVELFQTQEKWRSSNRRLSA